MFKNNCVKKLIILVIKLEVNGPQKLEVYADYDRFVQIIFNITQNAIQFTENGTITISAERGHRCSIFRISDDGMGMSDEQLKNIWERYYKSRSFTKRTLSMVNLVWDFPLFNN